ncbi:TIGR02680 family protein [Sporolactobacillus sp. THM7-7]|nr:TIGR02680 family protein [Sporolactobacillus sp. THM7-7]
MSVARAVSSCCPLWYVSAAGTMTILRKRWLKTMNEEKWVLNRAGIINFWYYDVAYFDFADGKLLLRGANGSGKSVTMSSLITVLLDGKKSPDRLDPFGSSARKMEDYLLGEEAVSNRSERTGYLFLEYKRNGLDQYITTGIGMQARRHKSMNTWYFVMTDNRRIGVDFDLYRKASADQIVPLTRQELSNRIGGRVVTGQKEYMALVNELIFGFDNVDLYDDLIKLLIQLRRPKLSKDFKPTVIYDILQQSLPGLKDDDLHSVADTLEQIDQARQQLEQARDEYRLMNDVTGKYLKYHDYCVREMAAHVADTAKNFKQNQKQLENATAELSTKKEKLAADRKEAEALTMEKDVLTKERNELSNHEVFQLVHEKEELLGEIRDQSGRLSNQEDKLRKKGNQVGEQKKKIEQKEWELEEKQREIGEFISEMNETSDAAGFTEHEGLLGDYKRQSAAYDFQFWKNKIKDYADHLRGVLRLFTEYEQKRADVRREDRRLGAQLKKVSDLDMEVRHWSQMFADERGRLEINLQKWRESVHFSIDDERWSEALQEIAGLYDEVTLYDEALRPARLCKEDAQRRLGMKDAGVSQQLESEKEHKEELEKEKAEWLAKKDPEPARSEEAAVFREQLKAEKIPARPFYELIDFQKETPQLVRNHIEAALLEAGYLDALVSEQDLDLAADRQLKPKPLLFAQTLSQYLVPDCPEDSGISEATVQAVIDSIQLDGDDSLIIDESGNYRLPSLEGRASDMYEAAYIGKASREAFRQREIERLNEEIEAAAARIGELEAERETIAEAMRMLDEDMKRRPKDRDLKYAFDQRSKKESEREQANLYREEMDRLLNQLKREEGLLKNRLNEETAEDELALTEDAYRQAEKAFGDYQDAFDDFKSGVADARHREQLIRMLRDEVAIKEEEYEELFHEVNHRRTDLEKTKRSLASVEDRLKLKSADDVRQRMEAVIRRLSECEDRIPKIGIEIGGMESAICQLDEKIGLFRRQVDFFSHLKAAWEETFFTEYKRYLPKEEAVPELPEVIRTLLKDFRVDVERKKRLLADFEGKFREVQGVLLDYRLEINDRKIVHEGEWVFAEEWPGDLMPRLEQWQDLTHQRLFECDYQGARAAPQFVIEKLNEYIQTQSVVLEEQDQRLFEDIILHSVGVTLKSLIDRSEKWVQQMNRILVDQENSSDLTLSIAWKPRPAETEDELDTQDLVSLLRRDAQLLTQEDMEKMIRHFRAKIASCKQRMQDEENTQSLDQVLKEVLDYRQWFTFEISYKRNNEPKKELTNHRFYKFSGGEKAIAMYLPLYTAVYARYQDAGKNAPYIIALDEAFAGVDERNIAEQFKAVEQLGFNYMMNSQALFGDYETVSSLNIYELIRPENANFVSVIAYHWNGKERQLLHEADEDEVLTE